MSRAFIASSPRRTWNGSPDAGTHRRLERVVAGRLLAGQVEDVLRPGQQNEIEALLLHPAAQPFEPLFIFGLGEDGLRRLAGRPAKSIQGLDRNSPSRHVPSRSISDRVPRRSRNCTLRQRLINSRKAGRAPRMHRHEAAMAGADVAFSCRSLADRGAHAAERKPRIAPCGPTQAPGTNLAYCTSRHLKYSLSSRFARKAAMLRTERRRLRDAPWLGRAASGDGTVLSQRGASMSSQDQVAASGTSTQAGFTRGRTRRDVRQARHSRRLPSC